MLHIALVCLQGSKPIDIPYNASIHAGQMDSIDLYRTAVKHGLMLEACFCFTICPLSAVGHGASECEAESSPMHGAVHQISGHLHEP